MSGRCSFRSLPSADEAQKERRTTYKAQTYKATTYAGRFPGIALQDALHHALRAQSTGNNIRTTRSRNALTLNALPKQQFSSRRRPGEFSQIESPTRQGFHPCLSQRVCLITRPFCRNDHSGDDRDGRAAETSMRKGYTVARCARWCRLATC